MSRNCVLQTIHPLGLPIIFHSKKTSIVIKTLRPLGSPPIKNTYQHVGLSNVNLPTQKKRKTTTTKHRIYFCTANWAGPHLSTGEKWTPCLGWVLLSFERIFVCQCGVYQLPYYSPFKQMKIIYLRVLCRKQFELLNLVEPSTNWYQPVAMLFIVSCVMFLKFNKSLVFTWSNVHKHVLAMMPPFLLVENMKTWTWFLGKSIIVLPPCALKILYSKFPLFASWNFHINTKNDALELVLWRKNTCSFIPCVLNLITFFVSTNPNCEKIEAIEGNDLKHGQPKTHAESHCPLTSNSQTVNRLEIPFQKTHDSVLCRKKIIHGWTWETNL